MQNKSLIPALIQNALAKEKIDPDSVNIILPTQTYGNLIGQYDSLCLEVVKINPDPEEDEVYEQTKYKKSLCKRGLLKIGNALGIVWDANRTGIVESTATKSRARAVGAMRKPNGEWITLAEEKSVDMEALREEQLLRFEEEAENGKPVGYGKGRKLVPFKDEREKEEWISLQVRKALLSYRKFKDERAMTGAKERVIKALVAIKSAYTDAELAKPFVFPRIILDVSRMLQDDKTRDAALARMTGAAGAIFGNTLKELKNITDLVVTGAQAVEAEDIYGNEKQEEPGEPAPTAAPVKEPPEEKEEDKTPETPLAADAYNPFADEEVDDFEDDIPWDVEKENFKRELTGYSNNKDLPQKAIASIAALLKQKDPDKEEMADLLSRIRTYLSRKAQKAGAKA